MCFAIEGLAWLTNMMKPLTNWGMYNLLNSEWELSLLYTAAWDQKNLCFMEEIVLHALPDLRLLLPLDFFTGVAMLSCSSLVSVSSS